MRNDSHLAASALGGIASVGSALTPTKPSRLLVALISVVLAVPAWSANYYVSTAGSDSNPGTLAQPFLTVQFGINAAAAGDTVFVRALTSGGVQMVYSERIAFVSKNGTAIAPITLRNYPSDVKGDGSPAYPALDQTGVTPPNGVTSLLTITNCSYLTIEGLEFRNYETANEAKIPAGIYITGSGTGVRLVRNKVHHIYQSNTVLGNAQANGFGIAVYGNSGAAAIDQLVFDGNEVYDLRTGQSESFTINGNVTNFQVINNTVHDCNNIGIDFIGFEQSGVSDTVDFARNGVVRGNQVYNIDSQFNPGYGGNFTGTFATQDDRNATRAAPGIYVDGGASITVERNHVHDCNIGMSFSSEAFGKVTDNCLVRDNLIRRNHVGGLFLGGAGGSNGGTQNCSVSNNTFFQNDTEDYGGGSLSIQHYVTGTTVKQNIFVCGPVNKQFILKTPTDGSFGSNAINWNLYSGTASNNLEFIWNGSSKGSFSAWQTASSQDANSLFVASSSALFAVASPVNATDFALITGSPAINAGDPAFTTGSGERDYFSQTRLAGGRVDIGMAEWLSGPEIHVEQPAGTALVSGISTVNFGTVVVPNNLVKTFTITNAGSADLTGLALTKDGTNAAEYVLGALGSSTLTAGSSTNFTVTFAPTTDGTRTANLRIASNDADEAVFKIMLSGVGVIPVTITTQPVSKTVNPNTAVTFTVAATGSSPITYQWQKLNTTTMLFENITSVTSTSYAIASVVETNQGDYRVVATNAAGSVPSNTVTLSVNDPVAIVAPLIASQTVALNSTVTFTVTATGTEPKRYQWRRNGINLVNSAIIAGATSATLTITGVQLSHAGDYSVVVSNMVNLQTSTTASLTVVDATLKTLALPVGGKAVITASYAGKVTGFVWKKGSVLVSSLGARYTFVNNVLTIATLQLTPTTDAADYHCEITGPGATVTTTTTLVLYNQKPEITLPSTVPHTIIMPDGMVSDTYPGFQIPFNSDPLKTPALFAATGLPAGLKLNTATGAITGKPAVALTADKEYAIVLTASNAKGSSSANASLLVKAMPYGTAGTFTGPIAREPTLNKNLGGRFNLVAATTGSYTASVRLGSTAYSAKGVLETDVTGANLPHGSFVIKRLAPASPLTVSFDIDSANHALINGDITDITDLTLHATFNGWRNKWGSVMPLAEFYDLKTYLGYYTFALDPPVPVTTPPLTAAEVQPQGMGYGSFTVASTGLLTVAGKLPDGTAYTCATFCGQHGEVLVYQLLYSNLGSVVGTLDITQGTDGSYVPLYGDNTLGGTVSCLRPATATHVYKTGFGPLDLTAGGGRYVPPVAPALLFGVDDNGTNNNAHVVFTDGGISGTSKDATGSQNNPNVNVRIKAGGLVFVPPNTTSTTLAITQSTGYFTGHATLVDTNPAKPGYNITRTPYYYGMIIRDTANGNVMRGYGFFLLPRRPDLVTQTVLTTDQLSGQVVLEKSPP